MHNLTAGVTYYFAIKVTDEWPLTSAISNVAGRPDAGPGSLRPPMPSPICG